MYSISPKGNAEPFKITKNLKSETLEAQLSKGYILSYLYYDDGTIKYNGLPKSGRFDRDIDDKTLFFTHSTGKSIISYIVGHAICEGYIASINAPIDKWPLMEDTLYFDQPLLNLLNMMAGDTHIIPSKSLAFKKTGRSIHGKAPLLKAAKDPDELWKSKPQKKPQFAYSNLTSDVLFNCYTNGLRILFQSNMAR